MAEKVVIGNAELWHGDCREILPTLPGCDLILTDPPYGIGKLWSGEIMLHEDGSFEQIRRPETIRDYFATLDGTPYYSKIRFDEA